MSRCRQSHEKKASRKLKLNTLFTFNVSPTPLLRAWALMIASRYNYTLQSESVNLTGEGYLLHKDKVEWLLENYFQNRENRKEASPLYMKCSHHIPKSLVITAEFCPLRDEGLAYVQKLHDAGIEAELLHFGDMIHAFLNMEDLVPDECTAVYQRIATFLNTEL